MAEIIPYTPRFYKVPKHLADVPSAWGPNESLLMDLIERFNVPTHTALEFGVDYGYSASALANFFEVVIGVDHFNSDSQTGYRENLYEQASNTLKDFPNIHLVCQDYQQYIADNDQNYDLIHIDIFHDYSNTCKAGRWAVNHAHIILFHDTESYPEVKRAVSTIADESDMTFYNFPVSCGLGILVRKHN
jgi:predicted O-methyltransferase YrrM